MPYTFFLYGDASCSENSEACTLLGGPTVARFFLLFLPLDLPAFGFVPGDRCGPLRFRVCAPVVPMRRGGDRGTSRCCAYRACCCSVSAACVGGRGQGGIREGSCVARLEFVYIPHACASSLPACLPGAVPACWPPPWACQGAWDHTLRACERSGGSAAVGRRARGELWPPHRCRCLH